MSTYSLRLFHKKFLSKITCNTNIQSYKNALSNCSSISGRKYSFTRSARPENYTRMNGTGTYSPHSKYGFVTRTEKNIYISRFPSGPALVVAKNQSEV